MFLSLTLRVHESGLQSHDIFLLKKDSTSCSLRNSCLYHAPYKHMLRMESICNSGDYTSLPLSECSVASSVPIIRCIATHLTHNQVKDKQFRGGKDNL